MNKKKRIKDNLLTWQRSGFRPSVYLHLLHPADSEKINNSVNTQSCETVITPGKNGLVTARWTREKKEKSEDFAEVFSDHLLQLNFNEDSG